ncbi:hypothetical protein RN001_004822 [Aquatica leii]|uniref:Uncharacterized protein n=1 Tax=Aquatica leii TaxID=1421715 RepID=A0AAN7SPN7_9COLE|nr:hypothetical protein RN001_004822 [Aquatica leii]
MSDFSDSDTDNLCKSDGIPSKKAKRLTKYNVNWENSYSWLRQVKENSYKASCCLCNKEFSCGHGGVADIKQRASTKSHMAIVSSRASSTLTKYFMKPETSALETNDKIAAGELTSVYHTVKHSLSYSSMDCTHKLLPYICSDSKIAQSFSCGRTKAEAIVCEVLAKESLKNILNIIQEKNLYFSIATDASNKKNRKMFPICVRFFDYNTGIENRLLEFVECNDECANQVSKLLIGTLEKNGLSLNKVSAFAADNTNVNFGRNHSIYTLLLAENNKIVKAGCPVHILHNAAKYSTDKLEVDVESLILKICSHFSRSAKRRADLKLQFEANEMQWEEIIKHVATRFLSLGPAAERVLKIWPAIKLHFLEFRNECPRLLEKIITSEEEEKKTLAYLSFLHNVMFSVEATMKKIESDSLSVVEMHAQMHGIREKIKQRIKDKFFGSQAREIMSGLSINAKEFIENDFLQFYTNFLGYLLSRYDFSENNILSQMLFLNVKSPINYDHFQKAAELLRIDQLNMDSLYEEF